MTRLQAVGLNFAVWKGLAVVLLAVLAPVNSVEAAVVNSEQAIRVDFSLPIDPPFALPAYIIDHTVFFGADRLNQGEGFRVDTFDSAGSLLLADSFVNSYDPPVNIIGCACTGGLLDRLLVNENFHLIITALSGSFEVTRVVVVAYDDGNGYGNSTTATGVISSFSIPEPATLALFGLGFAGLGAVRWRRIVN